MNLFISKSPFYFTCTSIDQLQARCGVPHHQVWLHPPVRPGDGHVHLHEQDQRGNYLRHRPPRAHRRHHRGQQERTGTVHLCFVCLEALKRFQQN